MRDMTTIAKCSLALFVGGVAVFFLGCFALAADAPPNAKIVSGNVTFEKLNIDAEQMPPCLLWDKDAKHFYCIERGNILRKISLDGFKDAAKVDLGTACTWLSMSGEGLLVSAPEAQQVLVVDPQTLETKRKIAAPKVARAASAPRLAFAYAGSDGSRPGNESLLSVLDLKKGEIVKQYQAKELAEPKRLSPSFGHGTLTPDGKFLFTNNPGALYRFKIDGEKVALDQSSGGIGGGVAIEISPDGQWVCLPSPGGSSLVAGVPKYSTVVFPVNDLSKHAIAVTTGPSHRAMAFDTKLGKIYANGSGQLIMYTMRGIKEEEHSIKNGGTTQQILLHPDGTRMLLLTDIALHQVVIKKP